MTLSEYYKRLLVHDWSYEYSDSHAVWERGSQEQHILNVASRESEAHRKLYEEFRNWAFYHKPKPKPPDEIASPA